MATKIVTKNSSTASAVPTASDLVQGELAVNVADKRLFTEDNGGAIVELGVNPAAEITANAGIALPDSQKATFGASDDLQIYHDGSNSVIKDSGTGDLRIGGSTNVQIWNDATSKISANFNGDGAATLYNNGSAKLATTSTGIDVSGTATMDGLTVDSSTGITINGPTNQDGKLNLVAYAGTQNAEARIIAARGNTSGTDSRLQFLTNNGTSLLTRLDINDNGDISFYEDTGTTPKLFWDASAESLGIGTSSLTSLGTLVVQQSADSKGIAIIDSAVQNTFFIENEGDEIKFRGNSNNPMTFSHSTGEKMRIDSSGNVGIGINNPAYPLVVSNNGNGGLEFGPDGIAAGTSFIQAYDRAAAQYDALRLYGSQYQFFVGASNSALIIDSSGRLLVGDTSVIRASSQDGVSVEPEGRIYMSRGTATGGFSHLVFYNGNGAVGNVTSSGSATAYNTSSDQRLKENIADADEAGSKIDAIQVRKYDWKADGSHQDYGMIAQELQAVAPEAVSGDADSEEMMGVDYSKLVPMLIKEIQSLRNRVAQLEE